MIFFFFGQNIANLHEKIVEFSIIKKRCQFEDFLYHFIIRKNPAIDL